MTDTEPKEKFNDLTSNIGKLYLAMEKKINESMAPGSNVALFGGLVNDKDLSSFMVEGDGFTLRVNSLRSSLYDRSDDHLNDWLNITFKADSELKREEKEKHYQTFVEKFGEPDTPITDFAGSPFPEYTVKTGTRKVVDERDGKEIVVSTTPKTCKVQLGIEFTSYPSSY